MNINQVQSAYLQYQSMNQLNKQEQLPQSILRNETYADTISISKEAMDILSSHESKFSLNSVEHVYSESQTNLATVGALEVNKHDVEYLNDLDRVIEDSYDDYQEFLTRATVVVAEIKVLDRTNSFDVSIDGGGTVDIRYKDSLGGYVPAGAIEDKEAMNKWVSENSDKRHGLGDLSEEYTLAKSKKDYETATGIINAGGLEYSFKMSRYASMSFGTNPKSYNEVDQMGTPGYVPYGRNQPKAELPNMNGSYS
jgi:hypothetical protein